MVYSAFIRCDDQCTIQRYCWPRSSEPPRYWSGLEQRKLAGIASYPVSQCPLPVPFCAVSYLILGLSERFQLESEVGST